MLYLTFFWKICFSCFLNVLIFRDYISISHFFLKKEDVSLLHCIQTALNQVNLCNISDIFRVIVLGELVQDRTANMVPRLMTIIQKPEKWPTFSDKGQNTFFSNSRPYAALRRV